jgi:putative DNA primase/helicase
VLQPGVLTGSECRITVVPGMNADGTLWTMQTIDDNGTKRFARASRKAGCFYVTAAWQSCPRP